MSNAPSPDPAFRFVHRLRVRWADVDGQQIVFNPHYLAYFDAAVTEYWRALGLAYPDGLKRHGGDVYVRKATAEYHGSARYDDWLDVGVRCARIGRSSMTFHWAVQRDGRTLVDGEVVYVYADTAQQGPLPVPQPLRELIERFESGGALQSLRLGGWAELQQGAAAVRRAVFVEEQGIDERDEWDALDAGSLHAVVVLGGGTPAATGRLLPAQDGLSRIGRMAVLRSYRGIGLGRQVLGALVDAARARGDAAVELHAQQAARGFYAAAGFAACGEPFDEVGIPHVAMRLALR